MTRLLRSCARVTLPDFFVIGAARSGTTSLHHYVGQHPDVFMCPVNEPNYFAVATGAVLADSPVDRHLRRGSVTSRSAYEALFARARESQALGEVSPMYLGARARQVAEHIHAEVPHARLIAVLRDPAEQAHANYLGLRRDGLEPAETFEQLVADTDRRSRANWVTTLSYHHRLLRYYELFGREQIRVYLYDDFVGDPEAMLADLFGFIGVDDSFVPDMTVRHGRTGVISNPLLRRVWTATPSLRRGPVRRLLPEGLVDRAFNRIVRDVERPELQPATRATLRDLHREETLALQDLIGRDLSAWLA